MATIEKRERKTGTVYLADVRIHGFPRQKKTFKRLTDARLWAQQTEASIRKGEFQNVVSTARSKTLKDVIQRYRDDVLPHKAISTQRAETTYIGYWERELGSYALSYIEPELISQKLRELGEAGDGRRKADDDEGSETPKTASKPKSRKTVKHYRDTLALLFKHAKKWGRTAANPLDGVNKITKIRNERTRFLSDEERARLLATCKASDNAHLYPIVIFALSTGARKGEVLSLTFPDLNLKRGIAVLRDTKNGDTRAVPIVKSLQALLKVHLEEVKAFYGELDYTPPALWVFPRRDGLAPIDIRTAWENARDTAGLVDFRFHDIRHSTASYLAMNGASLVEIAEVLGHRTLQMVRRYAHLSESHVKELVQSVNDKVLPAEL
jgi:integrase